MQKAKSQQPTINQKPTTTCDSSPGGPIPRIVDGWWFVVDSGGKTYSIDDIPKQKLIGLITALSRVRKRRYSRLKEKKYGNLNKGFTHEELLKFFGACKQPKARLAFMMQAFLGLRVGEVVKVKAEDIDFFNNRIRVFTEKARVTDFLYLHESIRGVLHTWINENPNQIKEHGGYVLFSENVTENRQHISDAWLRKEFRDVCKLAGLDEWYAEADDTDHPVRKRNGRNRKLHRLTTHSLRHYFITKVYNSSKNIKHTQKLARHTDIKSTQVYIYTNPEELEETMRQVFEQPMNVTAKTL